MVLARVQKVRIGEKKNKSNSFWMKILNEAQELN
jgi:hypothetical protein